MVDNEKNILYLIVKLTALAAVTAYKISADMQSSLNAVCILAFCCLFLTDFLVCKLCRRKIFSVCCISAELAGCFIWGTAVNFPLLLMLIFQFIDILNTNKYFYPISTAAAFLALFIFEPDIFCCIIAAALTSVGAFARYLSEKFGYYRSLSNELREEISVQQKKIAELKGYSKTLREAVTLEERNRFSARIHDRLGHGISGSIILLEGVKLSLKSNPEQAEESLVTAIENLRGSVDGIRAALREERPKRSMANITDFKEMLERFELTYGIKTDFSCEGDTEKITPQIWNCLKENLTEAMTNTVKHSNADKFEFHIIIYNKIIRAVISDNGMGGNFTKGIGLDAMEERTAACGGKCICEGDTLGFRITNIFRS